MSLKHFIVESIAVKAAESTEDLGVFTGLASVFNVKDRSGDVVVPGAFAKNLADEGSVRPLLYQHRQDMPIGVVECTENEAGLAVVGKLALKNDTARNAWELMKAGVLTKLSIGYSTESFDYVGDVRVLKELRLWEVSLVTIPANALASVLTMKSSDLRSLTDADEVARVIYDACLSLESAVPLEQKKGRVLSKRNRLLLKAALEALNELLVSADKADLKDENDEGTKSAQVDEASVESLRSRISVP